MQYDPFEYEVPWRENYEAKAVKVWGGSIVAAAAVAVTSPMPAAPFMWMAACSAGMALTKLRKALLLNKMQKSLLGFQLEFTTLDMLKKKMDASNGALWLGRGFQWESRHTQRVFEIQKRDATEILSAIKKANKGLAELPFGHPWIHGVEYNEQELYQPLPHGEGHTLVLGATGSGKTRLLDLLVTQAAFRDETVIVIDPKGDQELRDNLRRACEAMGQPDKFLMMHPAYPEQSIRIDPLYNYNRSSEIASRIASIIAADKGFADTFVAFGWQSLNNLVNLVLLLEERPTLMRLTSLLKAGYDDLLVRAIARYAEKNNVPNWRTIFDTYMARSKNTKRSMAIQASLFYSNELAEQYQNAQIEGIIAMFQHDETHFSKMIASLLPVLEMLTAAPYDKLLSPKVFDESVIDPESVLTAQELKNQQKTYTFKQIIKQKKCLYIGADSMADPVLASAVMSLLVADLTAVAADIYNFAGDDKNTLNLFVDEAEAVLNDPLISLANKGRGAKFRLVVVTQTISDLIVRLGSEDKAMQVLGNMNNTISLRIKDNKTQQYLTENLPETRVKYVMRTQGQNSLGDNPLKHGGNQGERLMEEKVELFTGPLMGMLPNLEYVANLSGGHFVKGRIPILVKELPKKKKNK